MIASERRAAIEKQLARSGSSLGSACVLGILLQLVAQQLQSALLLPAGTILFAVGVGFYAKARGRHAAWGALGLLSL